MQQAIMNADPRKFLDELNAVLLDGWEIVPGSWGCAACQQVADPGNLSRAKFTMPDGTTYVKFFFCVVTDDKVHENLKQGRQHVETRQAANGHD